MTVAQDLDLDMLGLTNKLLDKDIRNAERGPGLAPRLIERDIELTGRLDHPHAPASAAHRGLDDHRKTERLGQSVAPLPRGERRIATRQDRNAGVAGQRPGGDFVAQEVEQLGTRSHECNAGPRRRGQTLRSPPGTRTRDGSRRRASPWPIRRSPRCSDNFGLARRAFLPRKPRRPSSDVSRNGPHASRSPPCGSRARVPSGKRGLRFRRDWPSSACESRSSRKLSVQIDLRSSESEAPIPFFPLPGSQVFGARNGPESTVNGSRQQETRSVGGLSKVLFLLGFDWIFQGPNWSDRRPDPVAWPEKVARSRADSRRGPRRDHISGLERDEL